MNDNMNTVQIYTPNHDAAGDECTEFVPQDEWDAWNRYWNTINRSLSLFEEGIDSKDQRIKNLKTIREREVRFLVRRGWSKWDIRTVWEEVPPEGYTTKLVDVYVKYGVSPNKQLIRLSYGNDFVLTAEQIKDDAKYFCLQYEGPYIQAMCEALDRGDWFYEVTLN